MFVFAKSEIQNVIIPKIKIYSLDRYACKLFIYELNNPYNVSKARWASYMMHYCHILVYGSGVARNIVSLITESIFYSITTRLTPFNLD